MTRVYNFLDSSILNILDKPNVVVGYYEKALVDLNLVGFRTSQTTAVLGYFLHKARQLGYLTERTLLGYNDNEGVYYYGTKSQLELNNSRVVTDELKGINRSEYQSWKEVRSYELINAQRKDKRLKSLAIALGVWTVLLGSGTVYSLNQPKVSESRAKVVSKGSSTQKIKDSSESLSSIKERIVSLSTSYSSELSLYNKLVSDINSLKEDKNKHEMHNLLSSKLVDITLYNEIVSQLASYPSSQESYSTIEEAINSISDNSIDLRNELLGSVKETKEYMNSLGYSLD